MQTLPPCGLGGAPTSDGSCTGSSGSPNDAGGGVFSGVSGAHAASGLIAAGAILAGVLFAIWAVRKVGTFFRSGASVHGTVEGVGSVSLDGYACLKCGSLNVTGASIEWVTCRDCGFIGRAQDVDEYPLSYPGTDFAARLESLAEGESWCMACDLVYESDEFGCPCCGGGRREFGDDSDTEDDSPDDEPEDNRGQLRLEHGK